MLMDVDTKLSKILISIWKPEFYHGQQTLTCRLFSLKQQAHFVNFQEMSAKYPSTNNYSLSFFQVKMMFHEKTNKGKKKKKTATSAHNSII